MNMGQGRATVAEQPEKRWSVTAKWRKGPKGYLDSATCTARNGSEAIEKLRDQFPARAMVWAEPLITPEDARDLARHRQALDDQREERARLGRRRRTVEDQGRDERLARWRAANPRHAEARGRGA